MLYLSTRDDHNTYTAHIALSREMADDGGFFLPFHIPELSKEDILSLKNQPFNQNMAKILNIFFSVRLTGWDLDFYIGKSTCRTGEMTRKMIAAELWHNSDNDFTRAVERISDRMLQDTSEAGNPSGWWFQVAVRVAALFAIYGQMTGEAQHSLNQPYDVLAPAGDMIWPVAATVAKKMGLPIGTIVCSCREETSIWDLIHKGTLSPAGFTDRMLNGIEALIALTSDCEDASRFKDCCSTRHTYTTGENNPFSEAYYCTVTGPTRTEGAITSLYRTNKYLADPESACAFAGLQDYRAGTGAGRVALLISEKSPRFYPREISKATGITELQLAQYTGL